MARTKASVGAKISTGKSNKARCSVAPTTSTGISSGSGDKSTRGAGAGNPVCPRETPKWQKPITTFFISKQGDRVSDGDNEAAGSSKQRRKKSNVIDSSDDDTPKKPKIQESNKANTNNNENPKNHALDETLELEPLTGEGMHKIREYYPKGAKGKVISKKTKETKHAESNSVSEEEDIRDENGKSQDLNENSNYSSDSETDNENKAAKGKGKGKKTKEEIHVDCNGENEKEVTMEDENTKAENKNSNDKSDSENTDKENKNSNTDKVRDIASDNDASIVERKKREREDRSEEGNISKKIRVN